MPQLRPRQTWEEFCAELEADKERERKAIASWHEQMREQRPGIFLNWKQLLKAFIVMAGLVLLPWAVVYAVAAYFGLWP